MIRIGGGALALALLVVSTGCAPAPGTDGSSSPRQGVYYDPATGRFGAPPEDVLRSDRTAGASAAGPARVLAERPSPVAGGGVLVDLQGRFDSLMRAEVGADGRVTATCDGVVPGTSAPGSAGE